MLIPPVVPYPRIRPAFIFPNLELPRFFREQELQLEAGTVAPAGFPSGGGDLPTTEVN
jgi:hypothetical protein